MNKDKLIVFITSLVLAGTLIYFSTESVVPEHNIWVEAENAIQINSPFEITQRKGASGGKAITSTVRSDEFESFLEYKIRVAQQGKYRFWANCFWPGGCNNSFVFQINEGNRYVFGNDKRKFDQWHWVKGPLIKLERGSHILKIWNKEAFSCLDQMLLTSDHLFTPKDTVHIDPLNITFQEGVENPLLVIKNIENYKIITKDSLNYNLHILPGNYPSTEYFKIKYFPPESFCYTIKFKVSKDHKSQFNLKLLFDVNPKTYSNCQIDQQHVRLIQKKHNQGELISEYKLPENILSDFCELKISCKNSHIAIRLNNQQVINVDKYPVQRGYFAIGTESGGVYISEIKIDPLDEP